MTIKDNPHRLLRLPQVQELLPLSQSWIYEKVKVGDFPAPVKIGRSSFWKLKDVEEYLSNL